MSNIYFSKPKTFTQKCSTSIFESLWTIMATCTFNAFKIQNFPLGLRYVVNIAYMTCTKSSCIYIMCPISACNTNLSIATPFLKLLNNCMVKCWYILPFKKKKKSYSDTNFVGDSKFSPLLKIHINVQPFFFSFQFSFKFQNFHRANFSNFETLFVNS